MTAAATNSDPLLILLLCDFRRGSPLTIIDYVEALRRHSRHRVFVHDPVGVPLPGWLSLDRFDVVLLHYSVFINEPTHLDRTWRTALAQTEALKVAFLQDEYRRVETTRRSLQELDVGLLFTCWSVEESERIYPRAILPGLVKHTVLTGYVPDHLTIRRAMPTTRPVDVGYRGGWDGYWWLGELYYEKQRIAQEFQRRAASTRLRCDIAWKEQNRLGGSSWLNFLRGCRWTLGTESGASVVDFTGEIEARTREFQEKHPSADFREVQAACFAANEGRHRMNQVSPRVFEAIGCGTGLVLFDGEYSGVVRPHEHFVPLAKDFSNFAEVVQQIEDPALCGRLTERAFQDVIASDRYSYRSLVALVDAAIEQRLGGGSRHGRLSGPSRLAAALGMVAVATALPLVSIYNEAPAIRSPLAAYLRRIRQRMERAHPLLYLEKARLIGFEAVRRRRHS